jgi:Leucine-rich repeat (LRR) protein
VHTPASLMRCVAFPIAVAASIASHGTSAFPDDTAHAVAALTRAQFSLTYVDDKPIEATARFVELPPESLSQLGKIEGLRFLTIRSGYLDDSAVESIAAAHNLTRLRLTGKLTDKGISQLARLGRLRTLDLRMTEISPDGLSSLGELKDLEELVLAGTRADSKHVSLFPRLRVLSMASDQGRFPEADFSAISRLQDLQILDLSGNKTTTDQGLSQLIALEHLRALMVADTDVTDACVDSLLKLMSLQSLDVHGTQITKDGVVRLEQGLPQCLIRR